MQFTLSVLALLSASALASPSPYIASRDVISTTEAADAIQFAAQADDCNVGDCVSIVASAVCIAGGILVRSVPVVTGCVQGGAPSVSPHCPSILSVLNPISASGHIIPSLGCSFNFPPKYHSDMSLTYLSSAAAQTAFSVSSLFKLE